MTNNLINTDPKRRLLLGSGQTSESDLYNIVRHEGNNMFGLYSEKRAIIQVKLACSPANSAYAFGADYTER